jgi:serine/threonine-protein kinase HipA
MWRLSPAYDLTYGVDFTVPAYMNRHSISIQGKNEAITLEDLAAMAQRNDIQDYKSLIDMVDHAVHEFKKLALELDIDKQLIDKIEADFIRP